MNPYKFTVIFMRDEGKVRRMRVRPIFLRMLVFFLICLVLSAGIGGYCGVYFWKLNNGLRGEIRELERIIQEKDIALKHLNNLEKMIKKDDQENMTSLVVSAQVNREKNVVVASESVINLEELLQRTDMQILSVSNIQMHINTTQDFRLSFDINSQNENNNELVKGEVLLAVITKFGKRIPLQLEHKVFFELRRMKQFRLTVPLPPSASAESLYALRISIITPSNNMVFSENYPLSRIRL